MNNKAKPSESPQLEISCSRQWLSWQAEQQVSLAFTTYQAGKVFLIGQKPDGKLSTFERTMERCMGLYLDGDTLHMSGLYQLFRFDNVVPKGNMAGGFDKVFVPTSTHITGDIDSHDIAVDDQGRVIFVSTLFSCLATIEPGSSFVPLWKPDFVSKYAAEDRCHLNGLAMKDGKPKYVTAVSTTDVYEGWREHRKDGGVVIDVQSNEIVCTNLSMPHSPRCYNDKLYVLNSGTGYFGEVNLDSNEFEPIAFCRGYARGMAFVGKYAIVGLSLPRDDNKTFSGLALQEALEEKGVSAQCGLQVINLETGDTEHFMEIQGVVSELYDISVLPNVVRPSMIGFRNEEIRRTIKIGNEGAL